MEEKNNDLNNEKNLRNKDSDNEILEKAKK